MTHAEELLAVFETTSDEVDALRRGELPPKYRSRVSEATRSDAAWMTGLAVVLCAVLWPILGYLIVDGRIFDDGNVIAIGAIFLVAGVLPAAAVAWSAWTWIVHGKTPAKTQVVEGVIWLEAHRQRGMVVLRELHVDGRAFALSEQAFHVLRPRARYRVFFVPVADVVVAIEPLD